MKATFQATITCDNDCGTTAEGVLHIETGVSGVKVVVSELPEGWGDARGWVEPIRMRDQAPTKVPATLSPVPVCGECYELWKQNLKKVAPQFLPPEDE